MARRAKNEPYPLAPNYFFDLNGELAHGLGAYAVTEAGRIYSYFTHTYLAGSYQPQLGVYLKLRTPAGGILSKMLHQLVATLFVATDEPEAALVQHLDGNKRNNRSENLRWVSSQYVQRQSGLRRDNPSGYKGVTRLPGTEKYKATIGINGENQHLGCFDSPADAARAYNAAARRYEFGFLNAVPA